MRLWGRSRETPRRWRFAIPGLGEFRFYRFGVELYVGPVRYFLAVEAGTLGFSAGWVKS